MVGLPHAGRVVSVEDLVVEQGWRWLSGNLGDRSQELGCQLCHCLTLSPSVLSHDLFCQVFERTVKRRAPGIVSGFGAGEAMLDLLNSGCSLPT